jgi:hypothetical protein
MQTADKDPHTALIVISGNCVGIIALLQTADI